MVRLIMIINNYLSWFEMTKTSAKIAANLLSVLADLIQIEKSRSSFPLILSPGPNNRHCKMPRDIEGFHEHASFYRTQALTLWYCSLLNVVYCYRQICVIS